MVEGAERLGETLAAPRADERDDVGSLLRDPGNGGLRDLMPRAAATVRSASTSARLASALAP